MDFSNNKETTDISNDEEKISKEKEEYLKDIDELGFSEDEIDLKAKVSIPLSKGDRSNILMLNNIALEFKAILSGKDKQEGTENYVQVGRAWASRSFIDASYGILNSYSEQANLVTSKDEETFFIQFTDAFNKINNMMLLDRSILPKFYSPIIKLIKDRLVNIGNIITNNNGNMEAVIGRIGEEQREEYIR